MNPKTNQTVGVVVGRFQTHRLHDGHRYLLDAASTDGRKLLIVVGVSEGIHCRINPLDFQTRAAMLQSAYPEAVIVRAIDNPCDQTWSARLDALIEEKFPEHTAILFGSRDSCLGHYHGKHERKEIAPKENFCATDLRKGVGATVLDSEEFRAGMIYASVQHFPTSFQTVDIILRHSLEAKVLVGRKAGETQWRFPGGFADPNDQSLEQSARREAREEVGDVEIDGLQYVCSMRVNDHRYRKSDHKVMTAVFSGTYLYGPVKAGDDLEEVRWQDIDGLVDCLLDQHKPLAKAYLEASLKGLKLNN